MSAEHLMQEILSLAEHATWQESSAMADEHLAAWLKVKTPLDFRRICFVGCGTSLYAGQVGKYIVEQLTHLPAEAVAGFSFSAYAEPAVLGPETLVVGISSTGNTKAICDSLDRAKRAGAYTLGITSNNESAITRVADVTIPTGGKAVISVQTRTYVQSLIALYWLALHLAEARGCGSADLRAHWQRQIDRAAEASEQFLVHQRAQVEELATRYAQAPIMFILGAGPNIGTVEEASLKVIEMAKTFSEAQELENFLHGRLREVDSTTPLLLVAPHGKTSERLLDFLTVTDYVGAPSIVLTDQVSDDVQRLATHLVQMPAGLDELTTPLLYILPLYLLGYHMGLARGFDPAARRYPRIVPQEMRHQPGTQVK